MLRSSRGELPAWMSYWGRISRFSGSTCDASIYPAGCSTVFQSLASFFNDPWANIIVDRALLHATCCARSWGPSPFFIGQVFRKIFVAALINRCHLRVPTFVKLNGSLLQDSRQRQSVWSWSGGTTPDCHFSAFSPRSGSCIYTWALCYIPIYQCDGIHHGVDARDRPPQAKDTRDCDVTQE